MPDIQKLKDFFAFSRGERLGILLLFVLILILIFLPYFYTSFVNTEPDEVLISDELKTLLDAEKQAEDSVVIPHVSAEKPNLKPTKPVYLFSFNPNFLSAAGWDSLGLKPYQIKVVQNYLSKGGKFRIKSDLAKIYVIKDTWYQTVAPYLLLPDSFTSVANLNKKKSERVYKAPIKVDLNSADSGSLEKLPGIGQYLAGKIIAYRDRLGGFHSKSQVCEVYGVRPEIYDLFEDRIEVRSLPVKMNINSCGAELIIQHPYIRKKLGSMIVNYRKQHRLNSFEQLRTLPLMNDSTAEKIKPYFEF